MQGGHEGAGGHKGLGFQTASDLDVPSSWMEARLWQIGVDGRLAVFRKRERMTVRNLIQSPEAPLR